LTCGQCEGVGGHFGRKPPGPIFEADDRAQVATVGGFEHQFVALRCRIVLLAKCIRVRCLRVRQAEQPHDAVGVLANGGGRLCGLFGVEGPVNAHPAPACG